MLASLVALLGSAFQLCRGEPASPGQGSYTPLHGQAQVTPHSRLAHPFTPSMDLVWGRPLPPHLCTSCLGTTMCLQGPACAPLQNGLLVPPSHPPTMDLGAPPFPVTIPFTPLCTRPYTLTGPGWAAGSPPRPSSAPLPAILWCEPSSCTRAPLQPAEKHDLFGNQKEDFEGRGTRSSGDRKLFPRVQRGPVQPPNT